MSNKKRVLMLADADSFWTQRHIEHLLLPAGYEIVLFPIWGNGHRYDKFYAQHEIVIYQDTHTLPILCHIPRIRMWARIAANAHDLEKLGPFDIVHNHYLSERDLALGARIAKRFHAKWACSFWGSDLLRSSNKMLLKMRPYLNICNSISVHSELSREKIAAVYGKALAEKTTLLYFGQMGYSDIDQARKCYTQTTCKAHFGIDSSRFVICIGYSASSAQQQLPVLESLSLLPIEQLKKLTIVLQQTYSENDPEYVRRVREYAGRLPCQTVVLTHFMNSAESALLRLAADVFVLAIKTDAFSASMQEYLYAGACVIKAAWLGYPQLDDMGIHLTSFAEFTELSEIILRAMAGELVGIPQGQRALFPQLYSWDAVRESWLKLYQ